MNSSKESRSSENGLSLSTFKSPQFSDDTAAAGISKAHKGTLL